MSQIISTLKTNFFLICFLSIFFYIPLSSIFYLNLNSGMTNWVELFNNPLFFRFLTFTISQSILSIILSSSIGLITGYFLANSNIPFRSFFRAALTVPFLFPPLVLLLGFVILFDSSGILSNLFTNYSFDPFSFNGIIIAHSLYNISLMTRILESGFLSEPESFHQLADSLGVNKWTKFKNITFPHIKPYFLSAILLVFLYTFNSFAIVLILGQVKLQTLEVMIYNQTKLRLNYDFASSLVIIQLLLNLSIIYLYTKQTSYETENSALTIKKYTKFNIWPFLFIIFITILTWIPFILLFFSVIEGLIQAPSIVIDQLFSGDYDRFLGTSSSRVLLNSIIFGIFTSIFTISMILALIYSSLQFNTNKIDRLTSPIILIPMATSAITISFALIQTHGQFSFFSDFVSIYILSAHIIAALPFTSRVLFSSFSRVPKEFIIAAKTFGLSNFKIMYSIIMPLIKSGLLIAFLFSFAISLGEFGATYYLARGEWTTLSLAIERLFASRNTLLPNLYASLLVIFSLLIFWVIEKFGSVDLRL